VHTKIHPPKKRRYKKIAAAIAGALAITAALIPSLPLAPSLKFTETAPQPLAIQQSPEVAPADNNTPHESNTKKVLNITATAYAPGPHDNEQWGNKTFSGTQVRPGVIAVDPRVIPLGSHVAIKYPDGSIEYAVAEDTGGAIKGHRIDVAKWTVSEARKFGIKPVKVYILNDKPPLNEEEV